MAWTGLTAQERKSVNGETRNVFIALERHNLIPIASEFIVSRNNARHLFFSEHHININSRVGTRADIVCMQKESRRLVVVEIKTKRSANSATETRLVKNVDASYRPSQNARLFVNRVGKVHVDFTFKPPFSDLAVTLMHLHELQALTTFVLADNTLKRDHDSESLDRFVRRGWSCV